MEKLIENMREAAKAEYERAAAKYGQSHASAHEAFAVMLEEVQEAQGVLTTELDLCVTRFWNATKENRPSHQAAAEVMEAALRGAAELIQVAAMAYKATLPYSSLDYGQEAAGGAGNGKG